jgi:uncharacterized protein (TIGR02001 family)
MKKQFIASIIVIGTIFSTNTLAEINSDITLVSEYLNQGFTQTNNNPALQGNINWINTSGFHANVWATNVDYENVDMETNWSAGYSHSLNNTIDFNFGVMLYSYHGDSGSSESNYTEYSVSLGMSDFVFTNSWSFDFGGTNTTHTILETKYYYALPVGTLEFLVDYSYLLDDDKIQYDGDKSYTHWKISYHYNPTDNIELIAAYDGTDYKKEYDPENNADDRFSASITYSF